MGGIESLGTPPPDDVFQLVTRPELAPDEPEHVTVGFEAGRPVSFNGEQLGMVELLEAAAEAGCRHGCGIVDHIEDRIVGLKVRDIYEVPAAAIVLTAHQDLEKVVSTIHQNNFKHSLDRQWAYLAYAGLWNEPLRYDLDAFMDSANEFVTGEVTMKLFKGSGIPVARKSPYALYDENLASFGESGGDSSQSRARVHRTVLASEPDGAPGPKQKKGRHMIYNLIGRITVTLIASFIRQKVDPRTAALAGAGVVAGIAAVSVVGYLATKEVPEA